MCTTEYVSQPHVAFTYTVVASLGIGAALSLRRTRDPILKAMARRSAGALVLCVVALAYLGPTAAHALAQYLTDASPPATVSTCTTGADPGLVPVALANAFAAMFVVCRSMATGVPGRPGHAAVWPGLCLFAFLMGMQMLAFHVLSRPTVGLTAVTRNSDF